MPYQLSDNEASVMLEYNAFDQNQNFGSLREHSILMKTVKSRDNFTKVDLLQSLENNLKKQKSAGVGKNKNDLVVLGCENPQLENGVLIQCSKENLTKIDYEENNQAVALKELSPFASP